MPKVGLFCVLAASQLLPWTAVADTDAASSQPFDLLPDSDKTFCVSDEYKQQCDSESLLNAYWNVCKKASQYDGESADSVAEWMAAAKAYPEIRNTFAKFKEKYEVCYTDNHSCKIAADVEECLRAGDDFKQMFKDHVLAAVTQTIDIVRARVGIAKVSDCNTSASGAALLRDANSADEELARAKTIAQIALFGSPQSAKTLEGAVGKLKADVRQQVDREIKAVEAKWKPYTSALSGDKLKYFNDNYRCGISVYGKGGKVLTDPGQFKNAALLCTVSVDRSGNQPRWSTSCIKFAGNKAGAPRRDTGWGEEPPNAAFK